MRPAGSAACYSSVPRGACLSQLALHGPARAVGAGARGGIVGVGGAAGHAGLGGAPHHAANLVQLVHLILACQEDRQEGDRGQQVAVEE